MGSDFTKARQGQISLRAQPIHPFSACLRSLRQARIGNHTFRATGITAYLENGGTIERAQQIAAHESPKTTKLYDRTSDQITLDEIERIAV